MDNFAFIIHPIDPKRDVQRKFPILGKYLPVSAINFLSRFFPPLYISHIVGIQSTATQKEVEGCFVACPLTPQRMLTLPPQVVYKKIIQSGELAQKKGAKILGLGAFTSVVGDAGISVARQLNIPVTTGNSYTISVAVEAVIEAARIMGVEPGRSVGAVVGAAGAIGKVSAQLLGHFTPNMLLLGRRIDALNDVKYSIEQNTPAQAQISASMEDLRLADVIIAVSSAPDSIIQAQHLKSGAIVCDIARPRDVSRQVVEERNDVLVIEGGMVEAPGEVNFNFNFGFPPKMVYACMAETMILALEGRYESYTLGRDISLEQVEEIAALAKKHGFKLGGFRSFEKAVSPEYIAEIKSNIKQ